MRPNRLLRTSTFRYAVLYMAVFGLSVCGVLGFVYWSTVSVIDAQSDATIKAEITGLAEQYRERKLLGLVEIIRNRSTGRSGRRGVYLLTDPLMTPLAGNLTAWPVAARDKSGWIDFSIRSNEKGAPKAQIARARTFALSGGYHLLVGRDLTERAAFRATITNALIWALVITVALGIGGGLLLSRNFLQRLDQMNDGSQAILHGDLSQRMPVTGSGDEFDRLAGNLNEMLDQIERLMDGMRGVADNIAHDLRSPISRLRSRLEVTLISESAPEDYRAALEQTIEEADHILATFNALLAIALAESGALRDSFERLDLGKLTLDAADLYRAAAEDKGQTLEVKADDDCTIDGNRDLLSQAITNLLDNALNHTPKGGTITLAASRDSAGYPVLTVADTGPGIAPESRGRVLQRFVRLDCSRSTPGSGLGLSQVAATARLHHATLSLDDNNPGLRVTLQFPKT
ncbi:MAG: HAMP domain-containing histidine kinase [Alphaproteobacteria bacterium]|nr:HAMP domain-containing histidine kinase [Alphaproteobacteria bacterium]